VSSHGRYSKKLYDQPLVILRVRCRNKSCRTTHAVIPSFSTPGCSIGMKELDSFIRARASGKTVDEAGQVFCDAGMGSDYPETIQRRLRRYHERIRTLSAITQLDLPEKSAGYTTLILALVRHFDGDPAQPATTLNLNSIRLRCNPLLFSRKNILSFPQNSAGKIFPHNPPFRPPP
jgi:hypothetical protein